MENENWTLNPEVPAIQQGQVSGAKHPARFRTGPRPQPHRPLEVRLRFPDRPSVLHVHLSRGGLEADRQGQLGSQERKREAELKDGKVDGDTVSFVELLDFQGNELRITYTGKLSADGNEIRFTRHGAPAESY